MIYVDLDTDLNMEDDEGRNIATVPVGTARPELGSVLVAGRRRFWARVVIDSVEENADGTAGAAFHQVSAKHAASIGPLVADLPRAG